jgi:hypothetical protein
MSFRKTEGRSRAHWILQKTSEVSRTCSLTILLTNASESYRFPLKRRTLSSMNSRRRRRTAARVALPTRPRRSSLVRRLTREAAAAHVSSSKLARVSCFPWTCDHRHYRCSYVLYSQAYKTNATVILKQEINNLFLFLTTRDTKSYDQVSYIMTLPV